MIRLRKALLAAAALALLGTAAMVASGDAPERGSGGAQVHRKPDTPLTTFHLRTPSDLLPDPTCIKCNGGPIEHLTDADIQRAGDDAALPVLSMREEQGAGVPSFDDAPWRAWEVGAVPLADVSRRDGVARPGSAGFDLDGLVIRRPVAAVPEPASWLTMLVGFGAAGVVLRRRV